MNELLLKYDSTIKAVAATNKREFNYSKLAEECNELATVLLQRVNKKENHWPADKALQEELGQVVLRIGILANAEGWLDEVTSEAFDKAEKLQSYIDQGLYAGGV